MLNTAKLVGETIEDRYEVTERLHLGGMGVVYRARDTRLDRDVVLKIPHAKLLAERGFAERFEREIKSLMKLEHPHIVTVYDAGNLDIYPYAVFRYLAGGSLLKRIQDKGKLSAAEVVSWLPAIAGALDFMHSRKLLHRDVKPSNLLFDESGNLIVADFGVVKSTDRTEEDLQLTMKGEVPGSPEYMAPESITASDLTGAYDQYALGVTVYLALTGQLPYTYKDPLEALVRKKEPTPIREVDPSIPADLAAAVMKTMAADPAQRFATCADFAEAVRAASKGAPAPGASPPPSGSPKESPTKPQGGVLKGSESDTIGLGTPIQAVRAEYSSETASTRPIPKESETRILEKPRGKKTNKLLATVVGLMCVVLVLVIVAKFSGGGKKGGGAGDSAVKAPTIKIVRPPKDFVTSADRVTVEGQVDDEGAQVTVEGRAVRVGVDGWFTYELELPREGEFVLDVVARNAAGRLGEMTLRVSRDTKPPILEIPKSEGAPRVREAVYVVSGEVDEGTTSVTVDGNAAEIEGGTFRVTVPLTGEGELVLPVVARDAAGNETKDEIRLVRDATAPRIEVLFPPPGGPALRTTEGVVEVRGTVDDPEAQVTVAGRPVALTSGNAFTARVELKEAGEQGIAVTAVDAVGNRSTAETRVYQETPLVIYEPRDGHTTNGDRVVVRGRVYGAETKVSVDGTPTETDGSGAFRVEVPLDADGAHAIRVDATEKDGKVTTSTMRLSRDSVAPDLTVTDPEAALTTSAGSIYGVKGVVTDTSSVDVFVNGRRARLTGDPAKGASWEARVAFPVGTPELIVEAIDAGGNRSAPIRRELRMGTPEFDGLEHLGENEAGLMRFALSKDKTVVLLLVPETRYVRGAPEGDADAADDERPARELRVGPFLIGEAPITWQQYLFFCDETKRPRPATVGLDTHPAARLSWEDAQAYAEWAGLRLPTEAEWELAARGGAATRYPWGDEWAKDKANVELRAGGTTPVGSYKWVNGFGLRDVVGNVWEWCADAYAPGSYNDETVIDPKGPPAGRTRVLRGGSWRDPAARARLSARHHEDPAKQADNIGFRVARSPANPEKKVEDEGGD